jgi:hypothetical protein
VLDTMGVKLKEAKKLVPKSSCSEIPERRKSI